MMLLSLSLSSALGAHPTHPDNRGGAVSSFVHSLLTGADDEQGEEEEGDSDEECETDEETEGDSDEDTEGDSDEDTDSDEDCEEQDSDEDVDEDQDSDEDVDEELSGENGDNHGQCVREYAQTLDLLGENGTHGWAVSEAARVTCWDGEEEEPTENADEEGEDDVDSATAKDRGDRGKSADAHQKAPGKNKADGARGGGPGNGHGKGHGKH
jgi:hypothetical protein